jgi:hypothetical protein
MAISLKNAICLLFLVLFLIYGCKNKNKPNQEISYYKNGNISTIKSTMSDKITLQKIWLDSSGSLQEISQFKNGLQEGEDYYYYPNGLIKSQRTWRNNKKVGYGDDYWSNGRGGVKILYWYNNDTIQYYKCFDRNGKMIKEEGVHPSMDDYMNVYFSKK